MKVLINRKKKTDFRHTSRKILPFSGLCCIFNAVEPRFLYKNPLKWIFPCTFSTLKQYIIPQYDFCNWNLVFLFNSQIWSASSNFDTDGDDDKVIPIDWTPENGYVDLLIKKQSTPRPAAGEPAILLRSMKYFGTNLLSFDENVGSGSHLGLYIILNSETNDYYCSSTDSTGFKILLHNPTETPRITDFGMLVSPGKESRIVITPRISTTSRIIRNVPMEQRQCMFPSEANLKYFR